MCRPKRLPIPREERHPVAEPKAPWENCMRVYSALRPQLRPGRDQCQAALVEIMFEEPTPKVCPTVFELCTRTVCARNRSPSVPPKTGDAGVLTRYCDRRLVMM